MEEHIIQGQGNYIYTNSEGQGFPLVLCDGLGCNGFVFKHLRPFLTQHYQTIYWNYRGHGKSIVSSKRSDYSMAVIQDDLLAVLGAWGVNQAVLCGYSLGSLVAFDLTLRYPEKVRALISVCGMFGQPLKHLHDSDIMARVFPFILPVVDVMPDALFQAGWKAFIGSDACVALFGTGKGEEVKDNLIPYFQHMTDMSPKAFVYTLAAAQEHSLEDRLKEIQCPTLVLSGGNDTMSPVSVSKVIANEIPNAELFVVAQGTHIMLLEFPEAIQGRIDRFLKERVC